jgi:hypothetical protein
MPSRRSISRHSGAPARVARVSGRACAVPVAAGGRPRPRPLVRRRAGCGPPRRRAGRPRGQPGCLQRITCGGRTRRLLRVSPGPPRCRPSRRSRRHLLGARRASTTSVPAQRRQASAVSRRADASDSSAAPTASCARSSSLDRSSRRLRASASAAAATWTSRPSWTRCSAACRILLTSRSSSSRAAAMAARSRLSGSSSRAAATACGRARPASPADLVVRSATSRTSCRVSSASWSARSRLAVSSSARWRSPAGLGQGGELIGPGACAVEVAGGLHLGGRLERADLDGRSAFGVLELVAMRLEPGDLAVGLVAAPFGVAQVGPQPLVAGVGLGDGGGPAARGDLPVAAVGGQEALVAASAAW